MTARSWWHDEDRDSQIPALPTGTRCSVVMLQSPLKSRAVGSKACSLQPQGRRQTSTAKCTSFAPLPQTQLTWKCSAEPCKQLRQFPFRTKKKNQFRQPCNPFLPPSLTEPSEAISLKWVFASINFRTALLCHREIKCSQDCFYNTWDESCQGLPSGVLGSAGAWARVQRREQFGDGNCCPLSLCEGLGTSPFPLASAAASREEDVLCCRNCRLTSVNTSCKHHFAPLQTGQRLWRGLKEWIGFKEMLAWELLWKQKKKIFLDSSCITYSPTQKLPFPQITLTKEREKSISSLHHPFCLFPKLIVSPCWTYIAVPCLTLQNLKVVKWQKDIFGCYTEKAWTLWTAFLLVFFFFLIQNPWLASVHTCNECSFVAFFCNFWKCSWHNINWDL